MILDNIGSEEELQKWLKEKFTRQGWDARREVHPDGSRDRVDLLVERGQYRIGIETKYLNTPSQGKTIAQAYKQITEQYWNETYDGEEILLWAVCPYFSSLHDSDKNQLSPFVQACERADIFVQNFITQFGVGYLSLNGKYVVIAFRSDENEYKIPVFATHREVDRMDRTETDELLIREWVSNQRGQEYSPNMTGLSDFI